MSSHAPYQNLLNAMRTDRAAWQAVSYRPEHDTAGKWSDINSRTRLGVLRCLQFDFHREDEELIRYILGEEVASRRDDPAAGMSWSLNLATYLLATFQRRSDLGLFWQAKTANVDTFSSYDADVFIGFPSEYLFAAGAVEAVNSESGADFGIDAESFRELRQHIETKPVRTIDDIPVPTPEHMERWWRSKRDNYSVREADESIRVRYYAAYELADLTEARRSLDIWESWLPTDGRLSEWSTLARNRADIGQFEEAYQIALRFAQSADSPDFNPWDVLGPNQDAGHYALYAGRFEHASELLLTAASALTDEYFYTKKFARMILEDLFDLASATAGVTDPEIADIALRAFEAAQRLHLAGVTLTLTELRKAEVAARKLGHDSATIEYYAALVRTETKRG